MCGLWRRLAFVSHRVLLPALLHHRSCRMRGASSADCGLPADLAKLMKMRSHDDGGAPDEDEVFQKGYLKIPDAATRRADWKSVSVRVTVSGRLLAADDAGNVILSLPLRPERGSAFVQPAVAYAELAHTGAFDRPHVFKIGVCHGGASSAETYYFMARSFQEKAAWIEALQKATHEEPALPAAAVAEVDSPTKALADWDLAATLPADTSLYGAVSVCSDVVLLATSQGLAMCNQKTNGRSSPLIFSRGPEPIFQLDASPDGGKELLMVAGRERRLLAAKVEDVISSQAERDKKFRYRNLEVVSHCHLFAVGVYDGSDFVCAVDDCRVTILQRDQRTGEYHMMYAFSTDMPASCAAFAGGYDDSLDRRSLLVATDKVYEIKLAGFEVREFLDTSTLPSPSFFSEHRLAQLLPLENGRKFVLCFQDFGMFVDAEGVRAGPDIKWSALAAQFAVGQVRKRHSSPYRSPKRSTDDDDAEEHLWLAYSGAVEALDPKRRGLTRTRLALRAPQLLAGGGGHLAALAAKAGDSLVIRTLKSK